MKADQPVCGPTEQAAGVAGPGCTLCTALQFSGKPAKEAPPSCFRLIRAFLGRGLRHHLVAAATDLINGPLRKCKINAKLDRWSAQIAGHVYYDGLGNRHCMRRRFACVPIACAPIACVAMCALTGSVASIRPPRTSQNPAAPDLTFT